MKKIDYLTTIEALSIHAVLIKKYGGTEGAVDIGLLESALFRPQTGYYPDLISQATALFESLIINHPFTDGNKRTAFAMTDVFFRINGFRFQVDEKEIYHEMITLLNSNQFQFKLLLPWMKKSIKAI
jgi:death-on-curing protein